MKLQVLACNFIKKETLAQAFSCEICKISKNAFSYRPHPFAATERTIRFSDKGIKGRERSKEYACQQIQYYNILH